MQRWDLQLLSTPLWDLFSSRRRETVASMSKLRRELYKDARLLGDVESLTSPQKAVKRQIRKRAYKRTNVGLARILKAILK